jgi:hypothetical protein
MRKISDQCNMPNTFAIILPSRPEELSTWPCCLVQHDSEHWQRTPSAVIHIARLIDVMLVFLIVFKAIAPVLQSGPGAAVTQKFILSAEHAKCGIGCCATASP